MSAIHERKTRFVERNLFAYALLGVVVETRRIRAFIHGHLLSAPLDGPVGLESSAGETKAPAAAYAVLGALSLIRTVEEILGRWAEEGTVAAEPRGYSFDRRRPEDLFR